MFYTQDNIKDLDLKKYKRFVSFGCSFTRYWWPTWADCLAQEMPDAKFINTARSGAGNQYINTMLSLLSRKHNFGPETLVGIMWSTSCREDRFLLQNHKAMLSTGGLPGWHCAGNIFNNAGINDFWSEDFLSKLEPFHYMVRDASLISSVNGYLKSANFDTISFTAVDFKQQFPYSLGNFQSALEYWKGDELVAETLDLFSDLEDDTLGYILRYGDQWPESHVYPLLDDSAYVDYHPKSADYAMYLESWGIPLSTNTWDRAFKCQEDIDNITDPDWQEHWPYQACPNSWDEGTFLKNLF